jgi:hypothetical protein
LDLNCIFLRVNKKKPLAFFLHSVDFIW